MIWSTIPRVSRLRRIADRDRLFFITINLAPGIASLSDAERDFVLDQIGRQHRERDFYLFGYVVMPTHLHLLLSPERRGMAALMHRLKRFSSEIILKERGLKSAFWQPRYFDFALRRAGDFRDKLEYIHNNPVEAGLAQSPSEWRWSSAAPGVNRGLKTDAVVLPVDRNTRLRRGPRG